MTTSHFDRGALPPARMFYEGEIGKLTRPNRKGWCLANCPFHESKSQKSFSINVENGGFHCFGCDAKGGDLIDFVRLRYKLSFIAAGNLLGCRRDMDADERQHLEERAARVRHEKELAEQAKLEQRAKILALRDEIHTTAAIYQEISHRLSELQRGIPEAYEGEQDHCWACVALALDDLRMCEGEYSCAAGLESPYAD